METRSKTHADRPDQYGAPSVERPKTAEARRAFSAGPLEQRIWSCAPNGAASYCGVMTLSITWITPLEAMTSGFLMAAWFTFAVRPAAFTLSSLPDRVS